MKLGMLSSTAFAFSNSQRDNAAMQSPAREAPDQQRGVDAMPESSERIVERTRIGVFRIKNSVDHLSALLQDFPQQGNERVRLRTLAFQRNASTAFFPSLRLP